MSNQVACSVKDLVLSINKDKLILDNVSFEITKGSLTCLTGANGAGKSLLMRSIKGLLKIDSGSIFVDQKDLTQKSKKRNLEIGLVFQDADTQIVGQTVKQDLLFGLQNLQLEADEQQRRVDYVTSLLNIEDLLDKRPRALSGGEKRKVAIGGVLVMKPKIVMLDEPFANLDFSGVVQVLKGLLKLKEEGITTLIATHEIEKVLYHCDSIIILDKGKVGYKGDVVSSLPLLEDFGIRRPIVGNTPLDISELTWLK
ncbi:MAG: energy-coupling factor ABC transporter ATP-binding protein [Sphaerochaetaceae bacterium]|jgi:biotin transport system ATP-binding protein